MAERVVVAVVGLSVVYDRLSFAFCCNRTLPTSIAACNSHHRLIYARRAQIAFLAYIRYVLLIENSLRSQSDGGNKLIKLGCFVGKRAAS